MMLRYSLLLLLLPFFISSCAEIGCTDPLAENYSPNVVFPGGLCWYTSNLNFWWNEDTASALAEAYPQSLGLYIMNEVNKVQISGSLNNTFSSSPGCDIGTPSMTINYDIGEETHLVQYVEVWINSDTQVWSGEIVLFAQGCTSIEITY